MGNDTRKNKHFKRVNKKKEFQISRFNKKHKKEMNVMKEFDDLFFEVESGEISHDILAAVTGQTANYLNEVFHQEKLKNSNVEELSV